MYKYLEIIKDKNNEVVKRLDVTSWYEYQFKSR